MICCCHQCWIANILFNAELVNSGVASIGHLSSTIMASQIAYDE